MHVVFGVSAVAMLLTTVWMLAADHTREWKDYQREFRNMETWMAEARVSEAENTEYVLEHEKLASALLEARSAKPDPTLIQSFKELVVAGPADESSRLAEIDAIYGRLDDLVAAAQAARQEAEQAQANAIAAGKAADAADQALSTARSASDSTDDSIAALEEAAAAAREAANTARRDAREAEATAAERAEEVGEARDELVGVMRDIIRDARFREDNLARETKNRRAEFDKARADYEMGVGNAYSESELNRLQEISSGAQKRVDDLTLELQAAKAHREGLEKIVADILREESAARKALDDQKLDLERLQKAVEERAPNFGKRLLEMPVLDAFGSPIKVEQIWLPNLTLNNNFRNVARFDRCITCHQAMDKVAGSATTPAYLREHTLPAVQLATPVDPPQPIANEEGEPQPITTEQVYGLQLAAHGLLDDDDVTVRVVAPRSAAAEAGLRTGDVIEEINEVAMLSREQAREYLLDRVGWGQPLTLTVRRGVPHPYSTHPRLDLFVGSMSPHPMGQFGCTICHEGQGSATSFKWSSHMPNTVREGEEWADEYGWFNNHHWIFPMRPERFAESSCLKCHHEVTELAASSEWPEPPAPKLLRGHSLINDYGCFGCHEIVGFDGPEKRIGPDMRLEPNYFAAALQLKNDPGLEKLSPQAVDLAQEVADNPEDPEPRRRLREVVTADSKEQQPALSRESHSLLAVLKDAEIPGTQRKVGPSLRHVASKVDFTFLYDWIRNPQHFRPTTRMPRFFGLWEHLEEDSPGHSVAAEFEPVEIRSVAEFLLKKSQPFEYLNTHDGQPYEYAADAAAITRGRTVFQVRGCLACHSHADFPEAKATQGPDLTRTGDKLRLHPDGDQWLYSWVRQPNRYHVRTLMPDVFLEPITGADGTVTDPAADVAAFLLSTAEERGTSGGDDVAKTKPSDPWEPVPPHDEAAGNDPWAMTASEEQALRDLAELHLKDKFPLVRAREYLKTGIPATLRGELKGDEVELVDPTPDDRQDAISADQILQYVGRRTVSKYGCYGCHDIPGYEDAKPIGTALADWGRKDPSRLAFENIAQYLSHHHGHGVAAQTGAVVSHSHQSTEHAEQIADPEETTAKVVGPLVHSSEQPSPEEQHESEEFFIEKVIGHEREGFLWQKLREPRSYDYRKTENKGYNERLRMPEFPFDDQQIEAISTFVLGLVAEPPAAQYVYQPDDRSEAIVQGRKVLEKFNCAGCHTLEMDRWDIEYREDAYDDPPNVETYDFVLPHFTPEEIQASLETDRRGYRHASLIGQPILNAETGEPDRLDEDRQPIDPEDTETPGYYQLMLMKDVLINGLPRLVGVQNLLVPEEQIKRVKPAQGGDLSRLLFPVVVADERTRNPNVNPQEAWGWLPPPLVGEGTKVQPDWLYRFLLDPYRIRPATVLRMPKFNMSTDEASALVDYFAAIDNANYPYEYDSRQGSNYLAEAEQAHPGHLEQAMQIVTNNNYCVKCHLVGDYVPPGAAAALAPDLSRVHERLRPNYVHPYIAFPQRFLPYTGMPVNVPVNATEDVPAKQIYKGGSSAEILSALTDLLMNFDQFTKRQYQVRVEAPATPPAGQGPAGPGQSGQSPAGAGQ